MGEAQEMAKRQKKKKKKKKENPYLGKYVKKFIAIQNSGPQRQSRITSIYLLFPAKEGYLKLNNFTLVLKCINMIWLPW